MPYMILANGRTNVHADARPCGSLRSPRAPVCTAESVDDAPSAARQEAATLPTNAWVRQGVEVADCVGTQLWAGWVGRSGAAEVGLAWDPAGILNRGVFAA